jgi:hypothetical protein
MKTSKKQKDCKTGSYYLRKKKISALKWFKRRLVRLLVFAYKHRGLDDFEILMRIADDVYPAYKFRWPQMNWLEQKTFWDYIDRLDNARGVNADRKWALAQLFRLCIDLPGDTAECGVFNGSSSLLICEAIKRLGKIDKTHHLFDSFEGISEPGDKDGSYWSKGNLTCSEEQALSNLADYRTFVASHKGWIPDRFAEVQDCKFCFVHIDVDLHQPTRDSLEFFYPRMSDGGIIVCDDYGFTTCPGATEAFDVFLADKPEAILALPGGGGFMIKGKPTAPPGPFLDLSAE